MADYDTIASFYDTIHGSRKATIKYVKQLLKAYHPDAKTVLSLACGTGVVERSIRRRYQISGLDISRDMLLEAKKNLPKSPLYQQDMLNFSIDEQFDIILCLFSSLNHTLHFDDWDRFFSRVAAHLKPGGVFVFDVFSELCLYNLVLNSPMITRRGSLIVIGEFNTEDDGFVHWSVHGHKVSGNRQDDLFKTSTLTAAFDVERIRGSLLKHFSEVLVEDPEQGGEVNERSELLYFVCQK